MYTLMTWEHEKSNSAVRRTFTNLITCYNLAKNGGYYKAQIINNETNVIEYEFKK